MSEYKKLTEQDLAEVAKIVPRERILWADEINEEYSHDELTATLCGFFHLHWQSWPHSRFLRLAAGVSDRPGSAGGGSCFAGHQ